MNIHKFLRSKAEKLKVGESGLVALDWWNGNRSVLVDVDLTGMILGMTLLTKPEEIYRALIEATAYGTRKIIENFEQNGVPVDEFYASGGISQKDPHDHADLCRRHQEAHQDCRFHPGPRSRLRHLRRRGPAVRSRIALKAPVSWAT